MSLRTCVEFTSDLPSEEVEGENDFVQLGGKPVAEALRQKVIRLGCVADPVASAGDHGWEFCFRRGKLRLWCQVSLISGYLVLFEDLSSRWRIFGSDHPDFVDVMSRLGDDLLADARFQDVGWFRPDEVLSEVIGASTPLGEFQDRPCARLQAVESRPAHGEIRTSEPKSAALNGASEAGWSEFAPRPWRRFLARVFDLYVVGFAILLAIEPLVSRFDPDLGKIVGRELGLPRGDLPPFWSFALAGFVAGFVPLALTGSTLGKWLFGLKVARLDGRRPGWARAFKRELWALLFGYTLAVPVLSWAIMLAHRRPLEMDGYTMWDAAEGLQVKCQRKIAVRLAAAALSGAALIVFVVTR